MNITKGQKKKKSIELLRKLHIYEAYIDGFRKNDYVCYFEGYGGYWVYQDPELEKKMKALEKEYACTVYAITHEFTEFGECYSFLLVTDYKEEWDNLIYPEGNKYYAFAYVWNKDERHLFGVRYDRRTKFRRRDCKICIRRLSENETVYHTSTH